MAKDDETTLLIKLPRDLKTAFAGLCSGRGVSVSEELRRFMADELVSAVSGMATKDIVTNRVISKKIPVVKASVKRSNATVANKAPKCDRTEDMFANESKADHQKRLMSKYKDGGTPLANKPAKGMKEGKFKLSEGVMAGFSAIDKAIKTKK